MHYASNILFAVVVTIMWKLSGHTNLDCLILGVYDGPTEDCVSYVWFVTIGIDAYLM